MTPKEQGYKMPPEWAHHTATWLSFPHKEASWPDKFDAVPDVFIELVRFLCPHEEVHINVTGEAMEADIRERVSKSGIIRDAVPNIFYHPFPTNDAWCRDHGPMFVLRRHEGQIEKAIIDWGYNAWGNKYPPFDLDDVIPTKIAEMQGVPVFHPNLVMEGGSIDVNGAGCLLTTTSCLLNPNRNPDLTQAQIEQALRDYLGVEKILWLGDGIVGDDTDGHIDDLSRFVNPTTIVTAVEADTEDENCKPLHENLLMLRSLTDLNGKPFTIVEIPMPPPIEYDGQRLPASYANFYIANHVVLVPTYRHANDAVAIETLQRLFPTRRVVGIDCIELIWGLGAIHCVTHEEPSLQGIDSLL